VNGSNGFRELVALYKDAPDAGLHGASEWLLQQWHQETRLQESDKQLATGKVVDRRQWYMNRQGQTMTIIPPPGEVWIGEADERQKRVIDWIFAIASKEVTVAQFRRFRANHAFNDRYAPTPNCPVNQVSWYDAVGYCNWLSEIEEIPKDQWCYEPNAEGQYAEGMRVKRHYWKLNGYRLPTEAEWEYACRARSTTNWSCGNAGELLEKYAWYDGNSSAKSHPAGELKPNDLGLFDMQGNAWEWCQNQYEMRGNARVKEQEGEEEINNKDSRVLRGGSFYGPREEVNPGYRFRYPPADRGYYWGFRLARTFAL
jgi:formylglycine-generating enzyme required for sulfatase activity